MRHLKFLGPKYMTLTNNSSVYYANQTMKSKDWIGHSGYGGAVFDDKFKD